MVGVGSNTPPLHSTGKFLWGWYRKRGVHTLVNRQREGINEAIKAYSLGCIVGGQAG